MDLKIRLLSEDEKTEKIEIEPNQDEGFIGENSVLEPLNGNHQDSQKTNEPIIPENELSFLQNSDWGKVTPELYKNMNDDSDEEEDSQKSSKKKPSKEEESQSISKLIL